MEKSKKSVNALLRPVLKTALLTISGLIALFGLLIVGSFAYLYFSDGYYTLGISNIGDHEVTLKRVLVDQAIVYEGDYPLEATGRRRSDGRTGAGQPDQAVRFEFQAGKTAQLELTLFDPDLNEEMAVTYRLEDPRGLGCLYRLRYDNGRFLDQPGCE